MVVQSGIDDGMMGGLLADDRRVSCRKEGGTMYIWAASSRQGSVRIGEMGLAYVLETPSHLGVRQHGHPPGTSSRSTNHLCRPPV